MDWSHFKKRREEISTESTGWSPLRQKLGRPQRRYKDTVQLLVMISIMSTEEEREDEETLNVGFGCC